MRRKLENAISIKQGVLFGKNVFVEKNQFSKKKLIFDNYSFLNYDEDKAEEKGYHQITFKNSIEGKYLYIF